MPSPDYVAEKLYAAVHMLATSTGRLQDRLADSYTGALMRLEVNDFSDPDDAELFVRISQGFKTAESAATGRAVASMATLSDHEATALATLILDLHGRAEQQLRD